MDYLWTPWRYQYMEQVSSGKQPECFFCDAVARNNSGDDDYKRSGRSTDLGS